MHYNRKQLPKYCIHKPSGRAFVRLGEKMIYLGKYGSAASRREYDRIIAEYVANDRRPLPEADEVTVEQLIIRFLDYIDREINYSVGFRCRLQRVMRTLHRLYGKQPVSHFTSVALKTLRQEFVGRGICRQTVNDYISNIRQLFYWGCEEELVSAEVAGALRMVKGLQTGRTTAPDYREVKPINDDLVEKTLALLPAPFRDMVKLQRLISGRPQDVRNMRFCDIDRSGEVWRYVPFTHKTKKRGKTRELALGPRAQALLQPYFDLCEDDGRFVFVTAKGKQVPHNTYAAAIRTACKKANVPPWSPNQLRHAGGTEVREKYGLEYAQAVLGHANARTTEIYAQVSFEKAARVAREIG